jgi:hypothetical protein
MKLVELSRMIKGISEGQNAGNKQLNKNIAET